jgi:hypothetical protein
MTLESQRGRILPPNLDDRTWQDLVDEMMALIPHYAPTWTDHGPGDIGVTLIELFAWLAESVIYRLNRVPEKNYLAFLDLIGTSRNPPYPASAHLTFTAGNAGLVPAGTQACTPASETEPPVVFETDEDLRIIETTLAAAVLVRPFTEGGQPPSYRQVPVVGPPAEKFPLAVPAGQQVQLCLGFDRGDHRDLQLRVRLYRPAVDSDEISVSWHFSPAPVGGAAPGPVDWQLIDGGADNGSVSDGTEGLRHDGVVVLRLPARWSAQRPTAPAPGTRTILPDAPAWPAAALRPDGPAVTDGRFWVGMRVTNRSDAPVEIGVDRVLHNAALAHTALTLRTPERLGASTGQPLQTFALAHRPLFRAPDLRGPYGHLRVSVRVSSTAQPVTWALVEDFPHGPGQVYRLNPVTGEISFGDHDDRTGTGRGSIPPLGATIEAVYRYVAAGAAGNAAAGRVTVLDSSTRTVATAVTNLGAGFDGADEEPIEAALRRAPEELKIRDRAVTADDFEFLAGEASTEVAIVRCLPPQLMEPTTVGTAAFTPWQYAGINRAPGVVNVIIVPDPGADVPRPQPSPDLTRTVQRHLDQRRDVTARLLVRGPVYLPIKVKAVIQIWPQAVTAGVNAEALKLETERKVAAFLHPVHGGPSGAGWQVGQHVFSADLFRAIVPSQDIGFVSELQVMAARPAYFAPPGPDGTHPTDAKARPFALPKTFGTSVQLADYELVCGADAHEVSAVASGA